MGANIKEQGALVKAPREAHPDGNGGVAQLDITATVARFEVPAEWLNNYVRVGVTSNDINLTFGDSDVTCVFAQASTVASAAITTVDNTGDVFFAGQADHFRVPNDVTHFAVIADTGNTAELYIRPA